LNLRPSGYEPDELPAAPLRDIKLVRILSGFIQFPDEIGAGDRARTGTGLLPRDFKSRASANSATPAWFDRKSGKDAARRQAMPVAFAFFGSKGGARTLNLSVNSRVLCH
jgi:hypothetical protein